MVVNIPYDSRDLASGWEVAGEQIGEEYVEKAKKKKTKQNMKGRSAAGVGD